MALGPTGQPYRPFGTVTVGLEAPRPVGVRPPTIVIKPPRPPVVVLTAALVPAKKQPLTAGKKQNGTGDAPAKGKRKAAQGSSPASKRRAAQASGGTPVPSLLPPPYLAVPERAELPVESLSEERLDLSTSEDKFDSFDEEEEEEEATDACHLASIEAQSKAATEVALQKMAEKHKKARRELLSEADLPGPMTRQTRAKAAVVASLIQVAAEAELKRKHDKAPVADPRLLKRLKRGARASALESSSDSPVPAVRMPPPRGDAREGAALSAQILAPGSKPVAVAPDNSVPLFPREMASILTKVKVPLQKATVASPPLLLQQILEGIACRSTLSFGKLLH